MRMSCLVQSLHIVALSMIVTTFAGCLGQEKQRGLIVVNVLDKDFYDDCHIKGSIHVPYEDISSFAQTLDKNAEIVFYCSNYMCTASGSAAQELKSMGFEHVWAYEAGIAEWYQNGLPVEGSCAKAYLLKKVMQSELEERKDISIISTEELARKMNFMSE